MEIKIQPIRPFSPLIAKIKLPSEIIKKLNDYFDETIKDEKKLKKRNHANYLAGNVSNEIALENQFMLDSGWLEFLGKVTQKYVEIGTNKKIKEFNIIGSWIVSQFKHEYNPTHWHNGHISGAGFLKVPKKMGGTFNKKKNNETQNGYLQMIHGTKQFLSNSIYNIKPEVGDLYLFPNYMMHTVFPFSETNEERRSVSFNAVIDEDIQNVYKSN